MAAGIQRRRYIALRQVNGRMACDCKDKARVWQRDVLKAYNQQGTGIQDRRESRQPGLPFVLGAIVGQDRIGEVALEHLCAPLLPTLEILDEVLAALIAILAAQELGGTWRGTCSRIQQRYVGLSPRKPLVNDPDIPHNNTNKRKAGSCFS